MTERLPPRLTSLVAIIDKMLADYELDSSQIERVKREAEAAPIPALSLAELLDMQNEFNLAVYGCIAEMMADNRPSAYQQFVRLGELMMNANRATTMVTVRAAAAISDLAKKIASEDKL